MDTYLSSVYYNPKRSGGFGGVERLYNDVKKMESLTCHGPKSENG